MKSAESWLAGGIPTWDSQNPNITRDFIRTIQSDARAAGIREAAERIEALEKALRECADELECGLETPHELEAEYSKAARRLVAAARALIEEKE